ncbi:MAG: hypothetical protein PHH14_02835 [Candidatus Margulisbacteria bacterium]|nr:hypothetical protein [Candidatus Margulisiibacteriota bacterium]
MKNYRSLVSLLLIVLALGWATCANAQSKVIKKTVKKVVTPQITPVAPPETTASPKIVPEVPSPPSPTFEAQKPKEYKGLFGWGWNTDLSAKLLSGSLLAGVRGDIIYADPLSLGEKIGLAEDAVEYKLGLGFAFSDKLKTIPLFADMVVYLKEGSLFGLDPYVGAGLIYNLYGTGKVSGGLGSQLYLGMLVDFGFESRTGIALGLGTYNVGNNLSDRGVFITFTQPIKL